MNPLLSYIRHVVVIAVFHLIHKYQLPLEGAEEAVGWIAVTVVTTLSWLAAKYGLTIAKMIKAKLGIVALIVVAGISVSLPSCGADFPINIGLRSNGVEATYSSKGGLDLIIIEPNK